MELLENTGLLQEVFVPDALDERRLMRFGSCGQLQVTKVNLRETQKVRLGLFPPETTP